MRSDQTADFVASRPYKDRQERDRALYEHGMRVVRARRSDPGSALAREPMLTCSGTVIFAVSASECLIGPHDATVAYTADSTTHRVLNRSGEQCSTQLCVRHWSEHKREEGDDPDLPDAEVRYSRALAGGE